MSLKPLTYPPLNTPKVVADGVWIVDGLSIGFGMLGVKLEHPTRMTVLALQDGSLLLHSPTAHTPELKDAIDALGNVRWIVGPNRVHYWWVADWHAAYPDAQVWLAPRIREQAARAGKPIDFAVHDLDATQAYPWEPDILTVATPRGRFMTEYELFHRATRTLVLTDLVENHELEKIDSSLTRMFFRIAGATGQAPRDVRWFVAREPLRRAIETMIAWQPERILLCHGRWYERDGVAELHRIFEWLLPARVGA